MKLVLRVNAKQRLIITSQAVDQLLAHVQQKWWQREAGGVLLGRHLIANTFNVKCNISLHVKWGKKYQQRVHVHVHINLYELI